MTFVQSVGSLEDFAVASDRTCGVYVIINNNSNGFYVGSSKRVGRRLWTHLNSLRKGKHHSIALLRAFQKYDVNAWYVVLHAVCATPEEALDIEQSLLDECFGDARCYNTSAQARTPVLSKDVQLRARATRRTSESYLNNARIQMARLQGPEMRKKCVEASLASVEFWHNSRRQGENLKRLQSKPVTATCVATGERQRFLSMREASEAVFGSRKPYTSILKAVKCSGTFRGFQWALSL